MSRRASAKTPASSPAKETAPGRKGGGKRNPAAGRAVASAGGASAPAKTRTPLRDKPRNARQAPAPARARTGAGHTARFLERLRRIPTAAWVCAAVAILNAVCWSLIVPPFQGPDEQAHFAYVQQLAEAQRLPSSDEETFSPEEIIALQDLNFRNVLLNPTLHPISSRAQQRHLQRDLSLALPRRGQGGTGVASSQPPLYYAIATVPYELGAGGTILDRMELIRLLSALLTGVTALFVFLFVREALPGLPWAWTVGGLSAALAPLLGFASSAVDPDALLFAVSAALLYCLARGFRRGLSHGLTLATGALVAIGFLTKLNFIGLAPGVFLGLILLTRRETRDGARSAYRSLALACAIAASPAALYVIVNVLSHHPSLGLVSDGLLQTRTRGSLTRELSYIWQLYLPRLPGMTNDFEGVFTPVQIWFKGLVGRYNWLETTFPNRVYDLALIPACAIAILFVRELWTNRPALRARGAELTVYAVLTVGAMVLIAADSYLMFPNLAAGVSEPRYTLPMLALGGAVLALAARGAGRRWGPTVGALIVLLVLAHNIFSQLLEISRYYG